MDEPKKDKTKMDPEIKKVIQDAVIQEHQQFVHLLISNYHFLLTKRERSGADHRNLEPTERLKTILENQDKTHDAVRANILAEARDYAQSGKVRKQTYSHEAIEAAEARMKFFLESEPDDPDADLAVPTMAPLTWPPENYKASAASGDAMDVDGKDGDEGLTAAELALRTMVALDTYDDVARESREFYEKALERRQAREAAVEAGSSRDVPMTAPVDGPNSSGFNWTSAGGADTVRTRSASMQVGASKAEARGLELASVLI
ncbi:hypothetical protein NA57DRAFT_57703 [Rhizodiscina lignyota]|uniref:Uncharacterized protein n=1 Tax=Rhizodiscina lignyota TaxID=1504668 RepID=A0A9P4I8R3_9PEZI|nr:hypothetical protein NA57DRAFT_57703 [Rhizodiscina lignyota]